MGAGLRGAFPGDAKGAAEALRRVGKLGPLELEILADLLAGNPPLELYPYRLEFIRRRRGRPTDYLKNVAENASITHAVERALAPHGTLENPNGYFDAAIEEVREHSKYKLSRSQITKALAAHKKVKESKSK